MANLNFSICQSETCKYLGITDETGLFNATTNPSGYRTTNLPEISRVQTIAENDAVTGDGNLQGEWFSVVTPQSTYHVWYDVGNVGTADPAPAGSTGIEVTGVTAAMSALNVAAQTVISINAFTGWVTGDPGFTATSVNDRIDITNRQTGNVTNTSDGTGGNGTAFTFTLIQAGVWDDTAVGDATGAYIEYEMSGVTYTHKTFVANATNVNITTDRITVTAHGRVTRNQVILESSNSPATLPGGLSINRIYYVIRIDDNTLQLATSSANATSGTAINITSTGSGTVTIKANVFNVYSTLPNITGTLYSIDTSDVGLGARGTQFPDGVNIMTYVVTGNGGGTAFTLTTYREFLFYCRNKCCVYKLISKIPESNCSCKDLLVERALFAFTMLQALKHAAQVGEKLRASSLNKSLANLCEENECSGCK